MQNPSYVDTMPQTVAIRTLQPAVNSVGRSRVEVLTQIGKAEPLWRELIQQGAICSRYQHYSWMSQWWDHIGSVTQAAPHVTVLQG